MFHKNNNTNNYEQERKTIESFFGITPRENLVDAIIKKYQDSLEQLKNTREHLKKNNENLIRERKNHKLFTNLLKEFITKKDFSEIILSLKAFLLKESFANNQQSIDFWLYDIYQDNWMFSKEENIESYNLNTNKNQIEYHELPSNIKKVIKEKKPFYENSRLYFPIFINQEVQGVIAFNTNKNWQENNELFEEIFYFVGFFISKRNITYEEEKRIFTDDLTQIFNRRKFNLDLEKQWTLRNEEGIPLTIFIIDIDFFKKFNDQFGHQTGDEVLTKIAKAIQNSLRPSDFCYRYGGEEFAIIVSNNNKNIIERIAKRIQNNVKTNTEKEPYGEVTLSIGIMIDNPLIAFAAEVVNKADKALYCAKETGRNCFCFYETNEDTSMEVI